ncbi:TonB-dependent receptor [Hymenobacter yonginensis]|uniref:TonB-dependent receptor n=1 Tax=Hymenobacter yonginensis TaxID=748197 RepID=A0ABY7PNG0_9BACT|nr:TonB-dependent receptor [Hymenobacter yonginensis]WBO84284.1 TonB-dependent receptor [Hymenobacter yonginensis]
MKKTYYLFLTLLFMLLQAAPLLAQDAAVTVSGVVQTDTGEPLPGATVFVKGTFIGSSTDREGRFQLRADFSEPPVVLSVSFVGYETREVSLPQPDNAVQVTLKVNATLTSEVIASASRVQEGILQAPVTVEKLNTQQVERIPTADLQVGLNHYKGIDVNSSSLLMNSLSTRGFNSAKSERLIQLTDYFDTQSPSLNVNTGNLTGLPELDVESIEIIHGPASALYGANAFNGVLLLNSKDPFVTEGLSVRVRGGQRSFFDGQVRYAQKLGEKFAFKVVGSYLTADDWLASNYAATSTLVERRNNAEGSALGYDAVNRYGELGGFTFTNNPADPSYATTPAALRGKTVFMPGFTEQDLVGGDDKAKSVKIHPSLSYLLTSSVKLTAGFNYSRGTASYQSSSRYRFKEFGTNQFHGEIKGNRWFVRGQSVQDFGAQSYDLSFLGSFIQTSTISPDGVGATYAQRFYNTYVGTFRATGSLERAQTAANATQLQPSDPRFQQLRSQIISDATPGRGARLNPSSLLNEGNAQYNLPLAEGTDLIVGGAYRKFRLGSNGNLFADDDARIQNHELGGYAQLTQKLLDERLKLAVAGRVDAFKNFDAAFSPRASVVYSAGASKQHNFRASYGRAFRSPTQLDQYIRLDVGQVLLLGNVDNGFQGYSLTNAAGQPFGTPGASLTSFEYSAAALKLERLSTYEAGYKGTLGEKLALDVNYYQSYYNDFIGAQRFIGNRDGSRPTATQLNQELTRPQQNPAGTPFQERTSQTRVLQVWTNARQEVRTRGAAVGASYSVAQPLTLTANYSLNVLDRSNLPDNFQSFFNTPKHKYNVGANGLVNSRLSYAVNYRWAQGHLYELPFAVGELADYSAVDAYVGYTLPQFYTTLQAGGSNLLDATNTQVYGGPNIGRLVFVGVQVDIK